MELIKNLIALLFMNEEKNQMVIKKQIAIFFSIFVISNTYANDEIVGKWKTIDDKSGVVRAIVQIYKNTDESYAGKIVS